MSAPQVLHLQDYRSRREKRYEQALALYSADRERALLLRYLWSSLCITSADRAAVVWVDEYGSAGAHGHVVLDLVSDRPRRSFATEPLDMAWNNGVPGFYDACARDHGTRVVDHMYRSVCAVALGSDGLRAWFLVADAQSPRARLDVQAIGELMYVAGEVSGILMHRDMPTAEETVLVPEGGRDRFAAWPILKDIEGYEKDEEVNRRISSRFLVARVVRAVVDGEMELDPEALDHQVGCVRREIGTQFEGDGERPLWEAVLDAASRQDMESFAGAVLALGQHVEKIGHLSGAREFYRSAYEAAVAEGCESQALDAARFAGRAWRRGSDWDRALGWYRVARSIAKASGDPAREAVVLDGVANVFKEKGNLPRARQVLDEALTLALASGDGYAIGSTYHDLGAVTGMMGQTSDAIRMTWRAVESYDTDQDRYNAMTLLAGLFVNGGDLDAAENAYAVVAQRVQSQVYRLYALSGFAKVGGLKGDRREFDRRIAILEAAGFESGPAALRAGDLINRAEVVQALGDLEEARFHYRSALEIASSHGLGQFVIQAEQGLEALEIRRTRETPAELPASPLQDVEEIREELDRMRKLSPALVGV